MGLGNFVKDPISAISFGMALMFGTAGLPHILMRFFTVPNAREARKSVFWATTWIGYFYILTFIIGCGARSRTSGENLFDLFMAPSSQELEPPQNPGRFSALLAVFAGRGLGVFPVSRLGADDVGLMRGLRLLGSSDGVKEEIHAIRSRRGQHHPLVQKVMAATGARAAA